MVEEGMSIPSQKIAGSYKYEEHRIYSNRPHTAGHYSTTHWTSGSYSSGRSFYVIVWSRTEGDSAGSPKSMSEDGSALVEWSAVQMKNKKKRGNLTAMVDTG